MAKNQISEGVVEEGAGHIVPYLEVVQCYLSALVPTRNLYQERPMGAIMRQGDVHAARCHSTMPIFSIHIHIPTTLLRQQLEAKEVVWDSIIVLVPTRSPLAVVDWIRRPVLF